MHIDNKFNLWETVYIWNYKSSVYKIWVEVFWVSYLIWDFWKNYDWYQDWQITKEKDLIGFKTNKIKWKQK